MPEFHTLLGMEDANTVFSRDGTKIAYLSLGDGPAVIVLPGVLSMASDYVTFAYGLAQHFTVHVIERRERGKSGPQGDDYSITKECEDVLALQQKTGARLLVGHSCGGLVALEVARGNRVFSRIAVYEPGVSIDGSMPVYWMPGYEKKLAEKRNLDALVEFTLADAPERLARLPPWLMRLLLRVSFMRFPGSRQMLNVLQENLREWREIARLDNSHENYREIAHVQAENAPKGIRIPVNGLKGRRPRPLDDGGADDAIEYILFRMPTTSAAA
jgi:pimeloyl-ACP methyl ester carboxylesterase